MVLTSQYISLEDAMLALKDYLPGVICMKYSVRWSRAVEFQIIPMDNTLLLVWYALVLAIKDNIILHPKLAIWLVFLLPHENVISYAYPENAFDLTCSFLYMNM